MENRREFKFSLEELVRIKDPIQGDYRTIKYTTGYGFENSDGEIEFMMDTDNKYAVDIEDKGFLTKFFTKLFRSL